MVIFDIFFTLICSPRDGALLFMGRWPKGLWVVSDSEFYAGSENSFLSRRSRCVFGENALFDMSHVRQNAK